MTSHMGMIVIGIFARAALLLGPSRTLAPPFITDEASGTPDQAPI